MIDYMLGTEECCLEERVGIGATESEDTGGDIGVD